MKQVLQSTVKDLKHVRTPVLLPKLNQCHIGRFPLGFLCLHCGVQQQLESQWEGNEGNTDNNHLIQLSFLEASMLHQKGQ